MRKRIQTIVVSLSLLIGLLVPSLAVAPMRVAALASQGDACKGLHQLGGTSCSSDPGSNSPGQNQIASVAKVVVNIISFIAGIAVVILIVVSGIRFAVSGGDSQAAAGARNMLVYAIIGLVIIALTQAIVHFVLDALLHNNVAQNTRSS
jgi:hypothetical protein